jgi:hypothetical protein
MVVRQRLTSKFLNDVFGVEKIAQHFLQFVVPTQRKRGVKGGTRGLWRKLCANFIQLALAQP